MYSFSVVYFLCMCLESKKRVEINRVDGMDTEIPCILDQQRKKISKGLSHISGSWYLFESY